VAICTEDGQTLEITFFTGEKVPTFEPLGVLMGFEAVAAVSKPPPAPTCKCCGQEVRK
jgi:hypothetical protein